MISCKRTYLKFNTECHAECAASTGCAKGIVRVWKCVETRHARAAASGEAEGREARVSLEKTHKHTTDSEVYILPACNLSADSLLSTF